MYRRTGLSRWSALLIAIVVGSVIIASAGVAAQGTPDVSPVAAGGGLASIPVAPGSEQAGADPEAEVTLNLGAEIDSGDPQAGVAFLNEIEISSKVFTPLVALTAENEVADAGATAMEVSEDGTVYTFTIRAGMTYTDGVPVTADNYAWAIRRACDPNVGGVYSNILYAIVGCQAWREADVATADLAPLQAAVEESITALDAQTLQITLTQASGYFPYVMATWVTYPSRQDLVEAGGATWWQSPETYIGNGPFTLASHSPGEEWVFERNEAYFRGSPGIARLVFREIDNTQTEFLAYQQGELDLIAPAASFLPQIEADPDLTAQFHRAVGANTYYFAFNMSAPPFDNLQVRQAFAAALNRISTSTRSAAASASRPAPSSMKASPATRPTTSRPTTRSGPRLSSPKPATRTAKASPSSSSATSPTMPPPSSRRPSGSRTSRTSSASSWSWSRSKAPSSRACAPTAIRP